MNAPPTKPTSVQRKHQFGLILNIFALVGLGVSTWMIVPDKNFGPFGALNLRALAIIILLITCFHVAGQLVARWLGPVRGLAAAGFLGGLVSSTAVTVGFSRQARQNPTARAGALLGITIACATMFIRVGAEAFVVAPRLAQELVVPLGLCFTCTIGLALWLHRDQHPSIEVTPVSEHHQHPLFDWTTAIHFGLFYLAVRFATRWANETLGTQGILLSSVIAGTNDVDAITLTVADLYRDGLDSSIATRAILLATSVNSAVKIGLSFVFGGRWLGIRMFASLGAAVVLGLLAVWISF